METFKEEIQVVENTNKPVTGTKSKATITEKLVGRMDEFMTPEQITNWNLKRPKTDPHTPDRLFVKIIARTHTTPSYPVSQLFVKPRDGRVGTRSAWAQWKRLYNEMPYIGQEVMAVVDEKGWYRFIL